MPAGLNPMLTILIIAFLAVAINLFILHFVVIVVNDIAIQGRPTQLTHVLHQWGAAAHAHQRRWPRGRHAHCRGRDPRA